MKVAITLCLLFGVVYGIPTIQQNTFAPSNGRIIGGSDSLPNAHPYQISLQFSSTGGPKSHRCGGSILDATHILTAAHCVDGVLASQLAIIAGAQNMKIVEPTQQRSDVSSFIIHPDWNSRTINHDVAILTLSTPLVLNDVVQSVEVAPQDIEPSGPAMSTGWGLTANGDTVLPDALQQVLLTMFSRSRCQIIYGLVNPITKAMVCANSPGQNAGACNGDSGSPLICSDIGKPYQCGVVSWGINGNCGNPNFPSVYANVANYSDWIKAQL